MATISVSTGDSVRNAIGSASAGDEVVLADGVHNIGGRINITHAGTSSNPIVVRPADGASPVFDWGGGGRDSGVRMAGQHWRIRGIEFRNCDFRGIDFNSDANDVVVEDMNIHGCSERGMVLHGPQNVTVRNCRSHDNFDNDGGGLSDGFTVTEPTAENILFENCRSYNNSDDGFDTWNSGPGAVTFRNCVAANNGRGDGDGNGFKLGGNGEGGGNTVIRCVAYGNTFNGFDWNVAQEPNTLYNCTAWNNDTNNYRFRNTAGAEIRNCISYQGRVTVDGSVEHSTNTWNLDISDPGFKSLDPEDSGFLRLASDSPCLNAGEDVVDEYNGEAPDLGAFEVQATSGEEEEPADPEPVERAEPSGSGMTANHGYHMPKTGQQNWAGPVNENFYRIDEDVPIVDQDAAKDQYEPVERALYVALDTGTLYVGNGSSWDELGTLN